MGLWGGLKSIGRGIGKGVKKAGQIVGNEVKRAFDPIVKGVQGDWKGALAGIGHNIKRGAQVGAVLGTGGVAGVGLGAIGAAGGAIEGGFKEGGGGIKDIGFGALKGYGGVQAGKALGNIGRNVAGKVGSSGAETLVSSGGVNPAGIPMTPDAIPIPTAPPPITASNITLPDVAMPNISSPQMALSSAGAPALPNAFANATPSFFDKAGAYLDDNKADLLMKGAGRALAGSGGGNQPMMDPNELALLEREALMREMMMGGGAQYRPQSRWA